MINIEREKMKNKTKLFSLISALAIGAAMTFTACGGNEVADHDHEWDEGTVTTESTCHSEGKRTYNCKVEGCEQTKTEPISMIAHSWDDGKVTKEAKCNAEGVTTYTCTAEGCGQTKTQPIEKTDHRYDDGQITKAPDLLTKGVKTFTCLDCGTPKTQSVEARADFSEQYYTALTEQNNWHYGYMTSFDAQTSADDFVQIEETESGVWKSGGIEIGKGYVCGDNAAIAYSFTQEMPEKIQTNVSVSFSGEESGTCLYAYLIINGECVPLNEGNTKDWSYKTENAIDIAQGDTFCLIFKNAGTGKAGGNLSFTLTPPCVHVWDSGKITKIATCTQEGEKEYSCVSCDEKIKETVEMIDHKYDEGVETIPPTETSDGVKTYKCEVCKGTKTEPIPQLGVKAADFKNDFTLENQNGAWSYGKMADPWGNDRHFIQSTEKSSDAWIADGGNVEIKAGWINAKGESTVAYTAQKAISAKLKIEFEGCGENTLLAIRVYAVNAEGKLEEIGFNNSKNDAGKQAVLVEHVFKAGETVYIMFSNEKWNDDTSIPNGNLDITVIGEFEDDPAPEFEGASFAEDFELNESGEFAGWQVGVIDYHWSSESFDFAKISAHNENGDAYHSNDPWIDIKGDWMAVNGMMGFAYHFTSAANVKVQFNLHGVLENGNFSLRWAIKDKDGNIKNAEGKAEFVKGGHDIEFEQDITVEAGEVLYLLVNKEEGSDQNTFDIVLTNKDKQHAPEFEGANFAEDFTVESNPNGGWSYGYVDYHFRDDNVSDDKEDFTFVAATDHSGEGENVYGWKATVGDNVNIDIRNDLLIANKGFASIAYKFSAAAKVNVSFKFTGNGPDDEQGKFNIRVGVKHADGTLVNAPRFFDGEVVTINEVMEFAAGDTIYFIIEHAPKGWDSGVPVITLTQAE